MTRHQVHKSSSIWDPAIVRPAIGDAFRKLNPRTMAKNPVMFVVEVGSILVTVLFFYDLARGQHVDVKFNVQLIAWLWFTVLFANFAEAMAEGRGKAQAATLRKMRTTPPLGHRLGEVGEEQREPEPGGDRDDEASRRICAPCQRQHREAGDEE